MININVTNTEKLQFTLRLKTNMCFTFLTAAERKERGGTWERFHSLLIGYFVFTLVTNTIFHLHREKIQKKNESFLETSMKL